MTYDARSDELRAKLFPQGVVICVTTRTSDPSELAPEEVPAVQSAVPARRAEFATGRSCAKTAMKALGVSGVTLPARADRAPDWPSGIVGSIAHTCGLWAAAVARDRQVLGIGLDMEPNAPLPKGTSAFILTKDEASHLPQTADGLAWDRLTFSAKESVFKALNVPTGVFLEFEDLTVQFEPSAASFVAQMRHPELIDRIPSITGRFCLWQGFLLTSVTLSVGALR